MPVSTYVAGDGTVYLRTHLGETSEEIANSLVPYIGHTMSAYLSNNYGYFDRYWVKLINVSGVMVTVETVISGTKHVVNVNAFDGFGTACTMIKPKEK